MKQFLLCSRTSDLCEQGLTSLEFQLSTDCTELLAKDTAAKNYSWKEFHNHLWISNNYRKTVSCSNNSEKRPYDILSTQLLLESSFHALVTAASSFVALTAPNIHKKWDSLMLLFSEVLFLCHLTTAVLLSKPCVCVCITNALEFEATNLHSRAKVNAGAFPEDGSWAHSPVLCSALLQHFTEALDDCITKTHYLFSETVATLLDCDADANWDRAKQTSCLHLWGGPLFCPMLSFSSHFISGNPTPPFPRFLLVCFLCMVLYVLLTLVISQRLSGKPTKYLPVICFKSFLLTDIEGEALYK